MQLLEPTEVSMISYTEHRLHNHKVGWAGGGGVERAGSSAQTTICPKKQNKADSRACDVDRS
jgi:hypothetical protein